MPANQTYLQKRISLAEAAAMVQSGQYLCASMCASEPVGLLSELESQADRVEDVHVWMCLPMRQYGFYTKPEMAGHFHLDNWFYGVPDRKAHSLGTVSYIPRSCLSVRYAAIAFGTPPIPS